MDFCTFFDSNYLSRGLTMYYSLIEWSTDAKLFIICLDDKLLQYLKEKKLANIVPISIKEIEKNNERLQKAKKNRSYIEYIFTLSPIIPLFLLRKYPEMDIITSMDADLFFFSDPSALIKNAGNFSVAITPHRFSNSFRFLEKYGRYNVSFQTFKNDSTGIACLEKWESDCLNWCYDKFEDNKFADQKYLDDWNSIYPGVIEFSCGTGVAPWNIKNRDISMGGTGKVLYKNNPLIFYHFHGLRNLSNDYYSIGLNEYRVVRRNRIIKHIYSRYINALSEINRSVHNPNNQIKRGMHLGFGENTYLLFMADLYRYRNERFIHIFNFNFFRYLNSTIKCIIHSRLIQ